METDKIVKLIRYYETERSDARYTVLEAARGELEGKALPEGVRTALRVLVWLVVDSERTLLAHDPRAAATWRRWRDDAEADLCSAWRPPN